MTGHSGLVVTCLPVMWPPQYTALAKGCTPLLKCLGQFIPRVGGLETGY